MRKNPENEEGRYHTYRGGSYHGGSFNLGISERRYDCVYNRHCYRYDCVYNRNCYDCYYNSYSDVGFRLLRIKRKKNEDSTANRPALP